MTKEEKIKETIKGLSLMELLKLREWLNIQAESMKIERNYQMLSISARNFVDISLWDRLIEGKGIRVAEFRDQDFKATIKEVLGNKDDDAS